MLIVFRSGRRAVSNTLLCRPDLGLHILRSVTKEVFNPVTRLAFLRLSDARFGEISWVVHKDDLPPRWKDEVRLSRKVGPMQSEAVAELVN